MLGRTGSIKAVRPDLLQRGSISGGSGSNRFIPNASNSAIAAEKHGMQQPSAYSSSPACVFYLVLSAAFACVGCLLTIWMTPNAMYVSWGTVTYCSRATWGVSLYCTSGAQHTSPLVYSSATTYSSVPFWVSLAFGSFVAAAVYFTAGLGAGFAEMRTYTPPHAIDDCNIEDDTKPGWRPIPSQIEEDPKAREVRIAKAILDAEKRAKANAELRLPDPNDYMVSVLFFARMFTLPIMSAIVCVSIADKSATAVMFAMSSSVMLGWLAYVASEMYAWIFVDPACKAGGTGMMLDKGRTPSLAFIIGIDNLASAMLLLWILIAYYLLCPPCFAYSLVDPNSVPGWIRACFGLYLGYLSSMTLYTAYRLGCVIAAVSGTVLEDAKRTAWWFCVWNVIDHCLHAACFNLFMIFAWKGLSEGGFVAF